MGSELINGVFFQSLLSIHTQGGKVLHAIKKLDEHFPQFGECYFSTAESGKPKAWKKHQKMICNLFVAHGEVKFVFFDDRPDSKDFNKVIEFIISQANYGRLIIHPGIWFSFSGIGTTPESIIMNAASIPHDPVESLKLDPLTEQIPYKWSF